MHQPPHRQAPPTSPTREAPIPPTDPARASLYQHPRPGMRVRGEQGYAPPPGAFGPLQQQQGYPSAAPDGGPPVRGLRAWTNVGVEIPIGARKYGFRHIGILDGNKIYAIAEEMVTWGIRSGVDKLGPFLAQLRADKVAAHAMKPDVADMGGEAWLLAIISPFLGIRIVEEEIMTLLEGLMVDEAGRSLPPGSLQDPEMFPWNSLPILISKFGQHPDIASFFGSLGEAATTPVVQRALTYLQGRTKATLDTLMPTTGSSPTSTDGSG